MEKQTNKAKQKSNCHHLLTWVLLQCGVYVFNVIEAAGFFAMFLLYCQHVLSVVMIVDVHLYYGKCL